MASWSGGGDHRLVGRLVITGSVGTRHRLRSELGTAIKELHDVGHMEDVLIESGKEEDLVADLVALQWAADRASTCCWRLCGLKARNGSDAPKELSRR